MIFDTSHHTPKTSHVLLCEEKAIVPVAPKIPQAKNKKNPERTCIVTRKTCPQNQLLRFVIDPTNTVTLDLYGKLPGRGYYVCYDRTTLKEAIQKNIFSKAAKQNVKMPEGFLEHIETQLKKAVLSTLNIARRSSDLIISADKIEKYIKKGNNLGAYITGSSQTSDNYRQLVSLIGNTLIITSFSNDALSDELSLPNVMHLGVKEGALCNKLLKNHENLLNILDTKD